MSTKDLDLLEEFNYLTEDYDPDQLDSEDELIIRAHKIFEDDFADEPLDN